MTAGSPSIDAKEARAKLHWPGLDIFRAVAILLVIVLHFPRDVGAGVGEAFDVFLRSAQPVGWAGVDLFFVLSGFLIGHLLFREHAAMGRVNVWRFWARRSFKIYPGFYFLIALSAAGIVPPEEGAGADKLLGEVAFLQNYLPHFWRHTWSLAVEEHFYLAMAIVFALPGDDRRIRAWPIVVGGIVAICLGLRIAAGGPFDYATHLYPTHLRIDSLFVGTLVSHLYYFHREKAGAWLRKTRIGALLVGIALIRYGLWGRLEESRFIQTVGFLLVSSGCACLVALVVFGCFSFVPTRFIATPMLAVGRISYATYLWHVPVLHTMETRWPDFLGSLPGFFVYCFSSIVLGLVATQMIEGPLLKLRDRVFPRAGGT